MQISEARALLSQERANAKYLMQDCARFSRDSKKVQRGWKRVNAGQRGRE